MGVFTFEWEDSFRIPPANLFKAYVLEGVKILPKAKPQTIKSAEILEGDGGTGSITQINFTEATPNITYVTHKIDLVDKDNLLFNYTVIGVDALTDILEKISYETKIVPSGDGGSIWKGKSTYYTKGDVVLDEDKVSEKEGKVKELLKVVEAYLLDHPEEL